MPSNQIKLYDRIFTLHDEVIVVRDHITEILATMNEDDKGWQALCRIEEDLDEAVLALESAEVVGRDQKRRLTLEVGS